MVLNFLSIGDALIEGENILVSASISNPRIHAELLLGSATKQNRVNLYMNFSREVNEVESCLYMQFIDRRCSGEPVQYIMGKAPFYGRDFQVGEGVFIPRFDSEALIERLMLAYNSRLRNANIEILDLCCGTGVLGLTAALEIPGSMVTLVDISVSALRFAAINAKSMEIKSQIEIVNCDVLKAFPSEWQNKFDYILANPPYIAVKEIDGLDNEVKREPQEAFTDWGDGLLFYQAWSSSINTLLKPNGVFFCEIDCYTSKYIYNLMSENFDDIVLSKDISGAIRVCEARPK